MSVDVVRSFLRRIEAGEQIPVAEIVAAGIVTKYEIANPKKAIAAILNIPETDVDDVIRAAKRTAAKRRDLR